MSNAPVEKFKIGWIEASVWENDGFHSVTLSRSYKNEAYADGKKNDEPKYKSTNSFKHSDVLSAIRCLERAEAYMAAMPLPNGK